MMPRRFVTLDVFTREPLAGNPLAVVLDSEGLDGERMQRIAREFNLSETVFLLPPEDPRHRARLRIFTPGRELPFAGHPTVGTTVLLALRGANNGASAAAFGLEETVGVVACVAEVQGERHGYARFRVPRLPEVWGEGREAAEAAWALGLAPNDIGFDRHALSRHSGGVPYDLVPVRTLDAVARAKPNGDAFAKVFGGDGNHPTAYVYTRETAEAGHHFHARMFAPSFGMAEDPATGSAVAALVGALMQFEPMGEGEHSFTIEQGYEMGRASQIALQLVIRNGALASAEIGGGAVIVSQGELFL
jgi:trans-2,3-dihydro-3-hydroxyanthranilate isomerase